MNTQMCLLILRNRFECLQYIGKAEIARIPIFGYFYKNNAVIVNRENKKDAYAAFLKAGERLRQGLSMCIFPEGGIPPASVFLKKFKNGPFKLAIEQNIAIIPIVQGFRYPNFISSL